MKPLPKTCLSKVRVRAGINEPVTVWWSTTEISGGVLRECRHRRTDTHLDSRALSLAQASPAPATNSTAVQVTNATANRRSFSYRPGVMNAHNWYSHTG